MRLALLTCALIVLLPAGGTAIWVQMSLAELVKQSELIVIGELRAIRELSGSDVDLGTIRADEVIQDRRPSRDRRRTPKPADVTLLLPSRRGPVHSAMIFYEVGRRGIWFLRRDPKRPAAYHADHPQRLQPIAEAAAVRAHVKAHAARR